MSITLTRDKLLSADEFYEYCVGRFERMDLVNGRIVEMPPVGPPHEVDPRRKQALVHRPGAPIRVVDADGKLEGEDVVPGFAVALSQILS